MEWVALGRDQSEIAQILQISAFTVKNHMQRRLFQKLNVAKSGPGSQQVVATGPACPDDARIPRPRSSGALLPYGDATTCSGAIRSPRWAPAPSFSPCGRRLLSRRRAAPAGADLSVLVSR